MPDLRSSRLQASPLPRSRGSASWAIAAAIWLVQPGAVVAGESGETARTPHAADNGASTVTTVVSGIVGYTRWPGETRSIRLCTLGQGRGVDELLAAADLGSAQRSVLVRAAGSVASASGECDVIYTGKVAGKVLRDILQGTLGRPTLMIGEGLEFCSDGGMFCLVPDAAEIRFSVNLDAIARSGLRVNPLVLRIARKTQASGP